MESSEVTKIFAKKMCKKYFEPTLQFVWKENVGCVPQALDLRKGDYAATCPDIIEGSKVWQRALISIDGTLQCKTLPVLGCIEEAEQPCFETMVWFSYDNSCEHTYSGGAFKWQRVNKNKKWVVCNKFGLISPDTKIEPKKFTPPDQEDDAVENLKECADDLNLAKDKGMKYLIDELAAQTVTNQFNELSGNCLTGMKGYFEDEDVKKSYPTFKMTECYGELTGGGLCSTKKTSTNRKSCLREENHWCSVEEKCKKDELNLSNPPNCNDCDGNKCVLCSQNSHCKGNPSGEYCYNNLCVECISNNNCSSSEKCENNRCVVDPTKVPKNVNWGSISKEYRCSEKGPGRAQKCCSAIGRKAVSIDQIKANLNEAKKAIRRINAWAIVAVEGGTFAGSGYNYEIQKGEYQSGGNAMCWK